MLAIVRRLLPCLATTGVALALSGTAAASPFGTLEFLEPDAIVADTDEIPVRLRFVLGSELPPLTGSVSNASGISPIYFPQSAEILDALGLGTGSFVSLINTDLTNVSFTPSGFNANNFFTCSGSFTSSCTQGPPYDFNFAAFEEALASFSEYDFQPGLAFDFLLGSFRPTGGIAPAGQYLFFGAGIFIDVLGSAEITTAVLDENFNPVPVFERDDEGNLVLDEFGDPIPAIRRDEFGDPLVDEFGNTIPVFETTTVVYESVRGRVNLAATPCANVFPVDNSCAGRFSRTVVASAAPVPLPAGFALLAPALTGLGVVTRRRR